MTAATMEMTAPAALANKKQFGQVIVNSDTARSVADKIRSAPKALAAFLRSALKAFRLDALAGVIGSAVRSAYEAARSRAEWLYSQVGKILGWNNVMIYAVTDGQARNTVLDTAAKVYSFAKAPFRLLGRVVRMVPFVGDPIVSTVEQVFAAGEGYAVTAIGKARAWADSNDNHAAFRWARGTVKWAMVSRVIRRFVPSNLRMLAWTAYFIGVWGPSTVALAKRVSNEPVVSTVKGHFQAAAAKSQDAITDRVLDGKTRISTTQPGTESGKAQIVATGEVVDVVIDIDSKGQRWVTWDGVTYAAEDLERESTNGFEDPIHLVKGESLQNTVAALDEARQALADKEAADLAAATEGAAPLPMPNRAAKRAYPAKKQVAGRRR